MDVLGDPVDAILLREVADLAVAGGPVAVLEDQSGALTRGVAALRPGVELRARSDSWVEQQAVAAGTAGVPDLTLLEDLDEALLQRVVLVVMRLPKALAALDEVAEGVARWADPSVVLLAGGRVKHMSRGMYDVLSRHVMYGPSFESDTGRTWQELVDELIEAAVAYLRFGGRRAG